MKKLAVILLVLILATTGCFAALIQIGPTARFAGTDFTDADQLTKFENYHIGADARFNFGLFEVAANALIGKNSDVWTFDTLATANLHLELAFFDFNVGAGLEFPISFGGGIDGVLLAGKDPSDFWGSLGESMILLRAATGVNIGGVGVAFDYVLPWGVIKDMISKDIKASDGFKSGRTSLSLLFNLF